jgi:2'-5' RNA ligase
MTEHRPFIDDPAHLGRLRGERYVVLRPRGDVLRCAGQVQEALRVRLRGLPVSYPAHPHVTLKGFPAGTALGDVRSLVARWAAKIAPLSLEIEGSAAFPSPHQVVVLRVRKTAPLFQAFLDLAEAARESGLADWPEAQRRPADSWIFHVSLVYCEALAAPEWSSLEAVVPRLTMPRVSCIVEQVEVVAFDDGREMPGGTYALAGEVMRRDA